MVSILTRQRTGPIGVDLGSRAVKLVQLSFNRERLVEAARWDLPMDGQPDVSADPQALTQALRQAREGRKFRGRDAVLCLGSQHLFVQNLRVPKPSTGPLDGVVMQEAESRIPFPVAQTEIRFFDAADVRQGDAVRREVIILACHRPVLDQMLQVVEDAGLRPVAVEVEASALLRCYTTQYRRDEDRDQRTMFVHIGNSSTAVMIAQASEVLFFKYVDFGGRHLDEAVARHLKMTPADAWALRRHNGDRRTEQQDPEVARSVAESTRPIYDRLSNELSMCVRYHSVTFRGQPLKRMVLAGGEATPALANNLAALLDVKAEIGDPLRTFEPLSLPGRKSQWDIALGLALKPME